MSCDLLAFLVALILNLSVVCSQTPCYELVLESLQTAVAGDGGKRQEHTYRGSNSEFTPENSQTELRNKRSHNYKSK